jgi:hypothetical protein
MMGDLETLKRYVKDYIFREGIRTMKLVDPNMDLRGIKEEDIWGEDPIYPCPIAYEKMAEGIVRMGVELSNKRRRTNSLKASNVSSRGRGEDGTRVPPSRGGANGGWRGGYRGLPYRGGQEQRGSSRGGHWMPRGQPFNKRGCGNY